MTSPRTLLETVIARLSDIGADSRDDEETRVRKALLVLVSVLILPVSLLWGTLYIALGAPSGVLAYVYFAISVGAIAVFARTRDFALFLHVELLDILLAPNLSMIPLGGFVTSTGVGVWGILAPMGALVFGGVRAGIRWYVAFLAVFLGCGLAGEILGTTSPLPAWFTTLMLALNIAVGGTIVFTLLALFAKQRQDALTALQIAQDQAENLLLNVLPRPIAERLKAEPQTIADQFTSASILFADVVDFTPRSEHLSPAEVVGILDDLFSHFDMLAERYAVEKIKTIGDCYMVAAGVPSPRPDHARALALMALDMVDAMRSSDGVGTPRSGSAGRDQFRPGGGGRHRPEALPVRPVGRCRQHRQPDGIAGDSGPDPDHPRDPRPDRGRVRVRAERDDPGQGQGRDGDLVPRSGDERQRPVGVTGGEVASVET